MNMEMTTLLQKVHAELASDLNHAAESNNFRWAATLQDRLNVIYSLEKYAAGKTQNPFDVIFEITK